MAQRVGCRLPALAQEEKLGKEMDPFPDTSYELDSSNDIANCPDFLQPISCSARAVSGVIKPPDPD